MASRIAVLRDALDAIDQAVAQLRLELDYIERNTDRPISEAAKVPRSTRSKTGWVNPIQSGTNLQVTAAISLSSAENAILTAMVRLENSNALKMHLVLIGGVAGYAISERAFRKGLQALASKEYISIRGEVATLKPSGRALVATDKACLTTEGLVDCLVTRLPQRQGRIVRFLVDRQGSSNLSEIAKQMGVGQDDEMLSKDLLQLQRLSLILRASRNVYHCAEMLFLD